MKTLKMLIIKSRHIVNESLEGETIEQQVERLVSNGEPIEGEAPLKYTERKEGILPECNIRTDRWEIAIDAMEKVSASYKARREERQLLAEKRAEGEQDKDKSGDPSHSTIHN